MKSPSITSSYEIEEQETEIEWKAGKTANQQGRRSQNAGANTIPRQRLDLLLWPQHYCYRLDCRLRREISGRIKGANLEDSRRFLGIGQEYKALLLAVLLVQPSDSRSHTFIRQKLKIDRLGITKPGTADVSEPVLRIDLQRPTTREVARRKSTTSTMLMPPRYWLCPPALQRIFSAS